MAFVSDFSGWLSSSESSDESSNSSSHSEDSSDESSSSTDSSSSSSSASMAALPPPRSSGRRRGRPPANRVSAPINLDRGLRDLQWIDGAIEKQCPDFIGHSFIATRFNLVQTPMNFFEKFFSEDVLKRIVKETNRYGLEKNENFEKTNKEEMQKFLGINLFMGIVKIGQSKLYWNKLINLSIIFQTMTRDRYLTLLRNIHVSEPQEESKEDKLGKIRFFVSSVAQNCRENFKPGQNLSVDEAMIGFKGRIQWKQYLPKKPTKWGFKIWSLADSETGYLLNMEPYIGKKDEKSDGIAYDVVTRLSQPYEGKNHHIWMDNFFSSPKLFLDLAEKKIWCTGTIRQNKIGWSKELVQKSKSRDFNSNRGNFCTYHSGILIGSIWKDKGVVPLLSSAMGSVPLTTIERRGRDGVKAPVSCPAIIPLYNKFMGGVDKHDQRRSYYSSDRRAVKWWHRYFWYLIDVCVVNSYILYKYKSEKEGRDPLSHLDFLLELIVKFTKYEKVSELRIIRTNLTQGSLIRTGKRGDCSVCSKRKRSDEKEIGKRRRSRFQCPSCHKFICLGNCSEQHLAACES